MSMVSTWYPDTLFCEELLYFNSFLFIASVYILSNIWNLFNRDLWCPHIYVDKEGPAILIINCLLLRPLFIWLIQLYFDLIQTSENEEKKLKKQLEEKEKEIRIERLNKQMELERQRSDMEEKIRQKLQQKLEIEIQQRLERAMDERQKQKEQGVSIDFI